MLHRVAGNLIDLAEQGHFEYIVHGCNCQNVMGSGIAREIRERYPEAYEADCNYNDVVGNDPVMKLGNFSYTDLDNERLMVHPFTIINAYTQHHFLPRGVDHFHYKSFSLILEKLSCIGVRPSRWGFPMIGMGLAGGNPDIIMGQLEQFASVMDKAGSTVTIVEFSPQK